MFGDRLAKVCPEIALFDSVPERKAVLKQFRRHLRRDRRYWRVALPVSIAHMLIIITLLTTDISAVWLPWFGRTARNALATGVLGGLVGYFFQYWWRNPLRQFLRKTLNERGVPICVPCGYDLRGQTEPRCPECGTPFDPRLLDRARVVRPASDTEPPA